MPAPGFDRIPLPTLRTAQLLALAAIPALLSVVWRPLAWGTAALDVALVLAFVVDAFRLREQRVEGRRPVPELLVAFAPNALTLSLENRGPREVNGRWLDLLPEGLAEGARFTLAARATIEIAYSTTPPRGVARFGDIHLALEGPWRLATRNARVPAQGEAHVYPDLRDPADALLLARPRQESGLVRLKRLGEGREFDALRLYRPGDDLRAVDWKATAKRGALVAREFVPERNQVVLLLVDCGRHLVAQERGRAKLDWAIEAALRLARTSLERGDLVGLIAFGAEVRRFVLPAKGRAHLRTLTEALHALEPELEESDYAAAFDLVARATTRRALVCAFTELGDEDSSRVVLSRLLALRPRHLPLLVALEDAELLRLATEEPADEDTAYARSAALRLRKERAAAREILQRAGAAVVAAPSDGLSAAAINAYLRIKERGLL